MRKSELEFNSLQYHSFEESIRDAVQRKDFAAALRDCVASFATIAPMIQFRKQQSVEPQFPPILPFEVICEYAPPLFEPTPISDLVAFLKSTRTLAKHPNNYAQAAETAAHRERIARRIWNLIEAEPPTPIPHLHTLLKVDVADVDAILRAWTTLGVIWQFTLNNQRIARLATRLDVRTEGVCPVCGVLGTGRFDLFLKPISCGNCKSDGYFFIRHPVPN